MEKMSHSPAYRQFDGGIFSIRVPCPHITLICVKLTNNQQAEACGRVLVAERSPGDWVLCVGAGGWRLAVLGRLGTWGGH